jgi:hypothetical protein
LGPIFAAITAGLVLSKYFPDDEKEGQQSSKKRK